MNQLFKINGLDSRSLFSHIINSHLKFFLSFLMLIFNGLDVWSLIYSLKILLISLEIYRILFLHYLKLMKGFFFLPID